MTKTRIEKDSLGDIEVPSDAYYGAQTERARRNFPVSGLTFPPRFLAALGAIKREAAAVNAEMGIVEPRVAEAIVKAANEVATNQRDTDFPLDIFQTGSGTSTNMNANEVIAEPGQRDRHREARRRRSRSTRTITSTRQSSNDVIPTAMHVAARRRDQGVARCRRWSTWRRRWAARRRSSTTS